MIAASLYAAEPDWTAAGVSWVRRRSSYVENARASFGPRGGLLVMFLQLCTLTSVSSIFLVLIGAWESDNLISDNKHYIALY